VLCQQAFFQQIPGPKELALERANRQGEDVRSVYDTPASEQAVELKDVDIADIFTEIGRGIDTWL
jgi:hypothetical protein